MTDLLTQIWPQPLAQHYRDAGYWRGESFGAFVARLGAEQGGRIALVDGATRLSYGELAQEAARIAGGLQALGLRAGERVLLQIPNRAELVLALFGAFWAGVVPVLALPAHRQTELAHLLAKSGAKALLFAARHEGFDAVPMALALQAAQPNLAHLVVVGEAAPPALHPFEALRQAAPVPLAPQDPSAVALVQLSGGSTGLPKLIPRTHDDYLYSARASAEICGLTPESVYLAALPAAHNFPMSSPGILGAFCAGARVVMSPNAAPETAFALIAAERVTITGLVPPLALLWAQAAARTTLDLRSLQVLQVGGAKLTAEAASRIKSALGCTVQQVFGMAEGLVNYTRLDDPEPVQLLSQGRPISPADEIRVVDDHGQPVPDGVAGHLQTRGPYTISAYHDEPAANARSFTEDGFYISGDIVARRADGNLEVRGRAADHINRAGEKISAEEIEDHLLAHPAVYDAVVIGLPDAFLGEKICAAVVLAEGQEVQAPQIKAFMRGRGIAGFKVPDQVIFVPAFAQTAVGKTSRKALRQSLAAQLSMKGATQ